MTLTFVALVCSLLVAHVVQGQGKELNYEKLYTTVKDEFVNATMRFSGKAPAWLNGTLVRNGPGQFEIEGNPKSYVTNNLDGFAKIAAWNFVGNNVVLFSTKFIRSTYYTESIANKKFSSTIFLGEPVPALTPAEVQRSREVGIDNLNINVVELRDDTNQNTSYLATNDVWPLYDIDLDDLSTLRKVTPVVPQAAEPSHNDLPDFLTHLSTAHPLPEPNTENTINLLIQASPNPGDKHKLKVLRIKSLQVTEVIASIDLPEISYFHSFSVTEKLVAILTNHYVLNVTCLANNEGDCYSLTPGDDPVTLYVVSLKDGSVQEFSVPDIFVYHHINAFNDGDDTLILDLATYSDPAHLFDRFDHKKIKDPQARKQLQPQADMKRLQVILSSKTVTLKSIPSPNPISIIANTLDFPAINEEKRSQQYCFVYGVVLKLDGKNVGSSGIAKKDVCTEDGKAGDALFTRDNWFPAEPTFVKSPTETDEDAGVLLVPYTIGDSQKTNLVILNAKDLTLIDMADGPTLIPLSQHGRYLNL